MLHKANQIINNNRIHAMKAVLSPLCMQCIAPFIPCYLGQINKFGLSNENVWARKTVLNIRPLRVTSYK